MEPVNADVFLSGALLRLDKPGGPVDADDEASRHLGVKSSGVAGFFDAENPLDPSDHLVRARVCRLVEVENAALDVLRQRALQRGRSEGQRGVVIGANIELVEMLEEQRPVGGVKGLGVDLGRLDLKADLGLDVTDRLLVLLLLLFLGARRRGIGQNFRHVFRLAQVHPGPPNKSPTGRG